MIPMLVHPVIFTNEVIAVVSDWNDVASAASPSMPTVNPINVENINADGPTVSYNRCNSSFILVELGRDVSIPFLQWACRNNLTNAACVLAFAFDIAFLFPVSVRYRRNFPMDGVRHILGDR